jgi:hypothetical protein
MSNTIVALYDDFAQAENAVQELAENDFAPADISLAASNSSSGYNEYATGAQAGALADNTTGLGEQTSKSVGIGAGAGGLGGLLVSLGLTAIPGIGPALVAGPLVAALTGAVIGAAGGGMAGALVDMGVSQEESAGYAEGIRRGGTLVTVKAPDPKVSQAVTILGKYDPVNINERMAEWRAGGWTGYDVNAEPYTEQDIARERARGQDYTY